MNVNVARESIGILRFSTAQPDNPCDNRIPAGSVHVHNFTGPTPIFKNHTGRRAIADFVGNLKVTQRRAETSALIAQTEFGSRNWIHHNQLAFFEQSELLFARANDDAVFAIARSAG